MVDTEDDSDVGLVDPDDEARRAVGDIPATYIDTWHLSTWRGHIRLTLGEYIGGADRFRTAVVMELKDAERLATAVLRMIERRKAAEQSKSKE
jgi:hypothetical protein